jgi:hypothetical protein
MLAMIPGARLTVQTITDMVSTASRARHQNELNTR